MAALSKPPDFDYNLAKKGLRPGWRFEAKKMPTRQGVTGSGSMQAMGSVVVLGMHSITNLYPAQSSEVLSALSILPLLL